MATYNAITNAEIDPESPVTESLMQRLRDNPIAIIEGAAGAPRATSRIITPGGSSADGALVNATPLSLPGFFEFSSLTLTAPKTFPAITLMRVNGNVTLSSTITAKRPTYADANFLDILNHLGGAAGQDRTGDPDTRGGGGGACGAGGGGGSPPGDGGARAINPGVFSAGFRTWLRRRVLVGGSRDAYASTPEVKGGGCLIMLVNGACDFTGGTITVDGESSAGPNGRGGAGAAQLRSPVPTRRRGR